MGQPASPFPAPNSLSEFLESVRRLLGQKLPLEGWFQNNVAANQAAVLLGRVGYTADAAAFGTTKWVAPAAGSLLGVWVKSNAARTAGTLTVEVWLNGAATGLTAVLNVTDTTKKLTSIAKGLRTFTFGDELELKITTDGTWAPTTADVVAGAVATLG